MSVYKFKNMLPRCVRKWYKIRLTRFDLEYLFDDNKLFIEYPGNYINTSSTHNCCDFFIWNL